MSIDTVACAVNYMDRYLSEFKADKVLLQLLAMVCLSLASKMFETQPITMDEMRMLSRGAFQKVDIRDVEKQVLLTTNWNLNPITAHSVARHVLHLEPQMETRALLETQVFDMLEMALKDHAFLQFKPSTLALASVFAAHMKSNRAVGSTLRTIISSFAWSSDDVRTCQRAFLDATTPQVILPHTSHAPFIDTTNLIDHHHAAAAAAAATAPQSTPHNNMNMTSHRSDSPTAIEDFVPGMNDENQPPTYYPSPQVYDPPQVVLKSTTVQHPHNSQPLSSCAGTPIYHSSHCTHHHHAYAGATMSTLALPNNGKKRPRLEV